MKKSNNNQGHSIQLPSISFLIPCYNGQEIIENTINHLINTFINKLNFKIIVLNDGSTDNTWKILQNLHDKYPDILEIYSQENSKLYHGRIKLVNLTKTEYFCFCDADDTYNVALIKALQIAQKYDCDIVASRSWRTYAKKHKHKWWITSHYCKKNIIRYMTINMPFIWSNIFKTSFIKKYQQPNFPIHFNMFEDICFNYFYFPLCSKFRMCKKYLYNYFLSPTSMSDVSKIMQNETRLSEPLKVFDLILQTFLSKEYKAMLTINEKQYQKILKQLIYTFTMYYVGIFYVTWHKVWLPFRKKCANKELWVKCSSTLMWILQKYNLKMKHPGSWWKNFSYFMEVKHRLNKVIPKNYYI